MRVLCPMVLVTTCILATSVGSGAEGVNRAARTIPTPTSSCAKSAVHLVPGVSVPASDLVAIDFLNTVEGVALTASQISCRPAKPGAPGSRPFPSRLVDTANGGRTWTVEGGAAPPGAQLGAALVWVPRALVFVSPKIGWSELDSQLALTTDGGNTWHRVDLGQEPVVALQDAGGEFFAVTSGHWQLWRADPSSLRWAPLSTIPVASGAVRFYSTIVLGPARADAVVATSKYGDAAPQLSQTSDGGKSWQVIIDPCLSRWVTLMALTEAPNGVIAVSCVGGAAAGSANHGFYVSTDRGRTWSRRAATTDLAHPGNSGLPLTDSYEVLATPGSGRYFLENAYSLSVSSDGGRHWSLVRGIGDQFGGAGGFVPLDFVDPDHGWGLVSGQGIIATVDGLNWRWV